jgi:hypothetical protein
MAVLGTPVQSQFQTSTLQEIFDVALSRFGQQNKTPEIDFMTSANMAMDVIFRRLMTRHSELIIGQFTQAVTAPPQYSETGLYQPGDLALRGGSLYQNSVAITVGEAWTDAHWLKLDAATNPILVTLPVDFFGFVERPYIMGTRGVLSPLPKEYRSSIQNPSTPRYYDLRGFGFWLFPTPSADCTVVGQYYQRFPKFTAMTDYIPLAGLLDQVLQEAIMRIGTEGPAVVVDKVFQAVISAHLEQILPFRVPKQISFAQIIEGGQRASQYYF